MKKLLRDDPMDERMDDSVDESFSEPCQVCSVIVVPEVDTSISDIQIILNFQRLDRNKPIGMLKSHQISLQRN